MLGFARRKAAAAALRAVSKGSGFGTLPRGALLLTGRPCEQHHGHSARPLLVVPSQLVPGLSLGGGARSRRLTSSSGGSAGSGSNGNEVPDGRPEGGVNKDSGTAEIEHRQMSVRIVDCTDGKGLLGLVEQHGESFTALHISSAWGALWKLREWDGTGDEGAVLQRLQAMARAKMQEMRGRELSNVARSMAKLMESGRTGGDAELVRELKVCALAVAGDFKPRSIQTLMQAIATMGYEDPDAG
ncbi:hypothetical protein T484DRAFT_2229699, partial [Baffinella frigidus]